eukprot:408447_1
MTRVSSVLRLKPYHLLIIAMAWVIVLYYFQTFHDLNYAESIGISTVEFIHQQTHSNENQTMDEQGLPEVFPPRIREIIHHTQRSNFSINAAMMTQCFRQNVKTWNRFNKLIATTTPEHWVKNQLATALIQEDVDHLQWLLKSKTLQVFVTSNAYRASNINSSHCGFDIDFVEVSHTLYRCGNGEQYHRDKCQQLNPKCQSYDILFNLDYLYRRYNNVYKYILIVEDDISFCGRLFQFIYNISLIDRHSNISMNLVFLSTGFTSYLIKTSYIPEFKERYVEVYQKHEAWHGYAGALQLENEGEMHSVDMFMLHFAQYKNISYDSWHSGIFLSGLRLTFHPSDKFSTSLLNHSYPVHFSCYLRNEMRAPRLYIVRYHSMTISGSFYQKALSRSVYQQIKKYCKPKQQITMQHTWLSTFTIQDCSVLIQRELTKVRF